MKNILAITFIIMLSSSCNSAGNTIGGILKKSYTEKLQLGCFSVSAGAGLSLPSGDIANVLNGGTDLRIALSYNNILFDDLSLVLTGGYCVYTGQIDNTNLFATIKAGLLGRYYLYFDEIPGSIFVEVGGGVALETLTVASTSLNNIDPIFIFGAGYEVGIVQELSLVVNTNYLFMPQKYIAGAFRDGSYINIGVGIKYELGMERRGKRK